MKEQQHKRVIISGGGTGGHIFPAISIANALKHYDDRIEILFVGAESRMEMEKVPAAGYKIVGLPVEGLKRKLTLKNFGVICRLLSSLRMSRKIIKEFRPDVVVGVGGYASGPVLYKAARMGIPTLIQEQNSYAGVTNKLLAKRADRICVAYDNMNKFFPEEKIVLTGNPVRSDISRNDANIEKALLHFGLKPDKRIVLVLGGSLGSATINNSILAGLSRVRELGYQLIWQTGKYYFDEMSQAASTLVNEDIKIMGFIDRMDFAYSIANLIISRSGAGTISELCIAAKPVVLVPSPNVAEDHQTMNAMALVEKGAAVMVRDKEAIDSLTNVLIGIMEDEDKQKDLINNINKMAISDSDTRILSEILKIAK